MSKYLLEVNYTLDGVKGLKSEGCSARVAAATALIESLGWEGRVLLLQLRCDRCHPHCRHARQRVAAGRHSP